ncbi:MAG: iron-sulfur cluster assembly scaffold protein [Candidatus Komeilibacteria bacterium]|nr:iron-sulfur cluster assembly scaffold protein [Candidatus Komeilibacteria bacterium]
MHETIYRHNIIDHYRNPRNFGKLKHATHSAGHANVSCGDQVQFQARVEKGRIKELAFTGDGCAVSIAATSMLSEFAKGKALSAIKKLGEEDIEKLLGIPISGARERCAMLGLETLQALEAIA